VSQTIAERVLLPAVRAADPDTFIVTNGLSCREQSKLLELALCRSRSGAIDASR
jgi:hypothetical protein